MSNLASTKQIWLIRGFKAVVFSLVVWGIRRAVLNAWEEFAAQDFALNQIRLSWLVAASLFYATGMLPMWWFWHRILWAFGHGCHEFPGMNRFVSGGRLYQRNHVSISFVIKQALSTDAPLMTVKLDFPDKNEPFDLFVKRLVEIIAEARAGAVSSIDREMETFLRLPHVLRRFGVWCCRTLDRFNLLPARMIKNDPMYTSIFVANLGSLGLEHVLHHLYEYGTCSFFAVLGKDALRPVVGPGGQVEARRRFQVCWTLDERINDAFYSLTGLRFLERILDDPEAFLGAPEVAESDRIEPLKASAVPARN